MFARTRLVAPLLFGSGFCALIYQTTWLREFRLIFGSSTAATAAVIGVFMAGLGFGGIILGQRSETKAQPLAFYATLELFIAVSAGISPLLIFAARHLYIALGGTEALGLPFGTLFRLILAALIMGTPTFLMGGTLPAAARAVVGQTDVERRSIGALYGANTLGAVAGVAVGTFYCFENLGNQLTLWLAAAVNVAIALAGFRLSKVMASRKIARESPSKPLSEEAPVLASLKFVLIAAGIVGFAFFLMELVWYRMLAPLLGGSTFSFGLILAVALLGIGLGGIAYGFFGLQRSASLQFFAVTCAAEAFFIALPYAFGDRIAMVAMLLRPLGTIGFHGHIMAWTALCSFVVLPAAFVSGLQFPLLIALLGKGKKLVGSQTGATYAWNTIGALAGSLAGGFGFIPKFSAPGVWRMVIVLLCVLSLTATLLALRERGHWRAIIAPVVTAFFAVSMLAATGPTAFWRHSQIGTGHLTQFQGSANDMRELIQKFRRETIWEADGIESSVALSSGDGLAFIVNGRADGNAKRDAGTQVMLGLIGAAVHPEPIKALVIGLGTGSTAGWLAAVPSIVKVDAIELEPAVLKVAERCAPVNHDAILNPKLHVTIGDAREVLLTAREKYDLIVSEPSNPYRAGIAGLFTEGYYQSVDRCLQPGGIFLQWVQAYDIDDPTIQSIYRTLGSVFPTIETWQTQTGDLALMASRSPVHYGVEALRARLAQEPFQSALRVSWQATGVEDFLGHYVGNNVLADTLQHLSPVPINTDDRTVIEFSLVRSLNQANGFQIANLRASAHDAHVDRPQNIDGEVDWSLVDESRLSMFGPLSRAEQSQMSWTAPQRARAASFASYSDGDLPDALRSWRAQDQEPKTVTQLMMIGECLAEQGDSAALSYIDKIRESFPWDADAIHAELLWRQRRPEEAAETLEKLFRALSDNPWPNRELINRSLTRAESLARSDRSGVVAGFLYDALSKPFSVFNNESDRMATRLAIGIYADGGRSGEKTLAAIESYEPHIVWRRQFLQLRKDCYIALNSPRAEQARRDLDEFMRHEAASDDVSTLTKEIQARTMSGASQERTETGQ
ncbi:MAG TPA: fused MFS/spermidine synthase [Chthoniobacterales bacterium]|nr:fused MFS/spermidine synthase [Chthoniobacterales bacterium]